MAKGRRVPPRSFDFRTMPEMETIAVNPSQADVDALMQPGSLTIIQYEHNSWCKAQRTQQMDDCRCTPDVRLLRAKEPTP